MVPADRETYVIVWRISLETEQVAEAGYARTGHRTDRASSNIEPFSDR
jgi:hypothetical protein